MVRQILFAFDVILEFARQLWQYLFTDIPTFLAENSNPFTDFLLGIIEFTGLSAFLEGFTLFGLLFSLVVITILVVYFFVP